MLLYLELALCVLMLAILRTNSMHEAKSIAAGAIGLLFLVILGTIFQKHTEAEGKQ